MGLLVRVFVVAAVVAAGGCYRYDPLWCLEDRDCADAPEGRRFCDLEGTYPASEGIARTCIAKPGALTLSVPATPADLVLGGTSSVPVTIERGPGLAGDVRVEAQDLTAGLSMEPVVIPASSTTGTLEGHVVW